MIYPQPRVLPGGDRYVLVERGDEMRLELNFVAHGLATKIAQYHKLRSAADEAEQFETRAKQFGAISERLARTRSALVKLADAGVTIGGRVLREGGERDSPGCVVQPGHVGV